MVRFIQRTIHEMANALFKRPCPFTGLSSWSAWEQAYDWLDHRGRLRTGDTVAFVERWERSPYLSLVVANVAAIDERDCHLALIFHDSDLAPDAGEMMVRPTPELLGKPLKRWPRGPSSPGAGAMPGLPYFNGGDRGGGPRL